MINEFMVVYSENDDFCAKYLGMLSSWIVVFREEGTISKRCVQFNILDSVLIFVPKIWGNYQVGLLSLGPTGGGHIF